MKKKLKLVLTLLVSFAIMMVAGVASCSDPSIGGGDTPDNPTPENPATSILSLRADKTEVLREDVVTLSAFICTEGKEDVAVAEDDVTYTIVEGKDFATLAGNKLTISKTAIANSIIKVKATVGQTDSSLVEIKVKVPLEGINISINGNKTSIKPGFSVELRKEFIPTGADTTGFTWQIIKGDNQCKIVGDVLMVNENAPIGTEIKIKAVCGEKESNKILSILVGVAVENVSISLDGSLNVNPGQSRPIIVEVGPEEATDKTVTWNYTQGEEYFEISNNTLYVKDDAPLGSQISFTATAGNVTSSPINVTVGTLIEEITISAEEFSIVKGNKVELTAVVNPETAVEAFTWTITKGSEYATISKNGVLTILADAPTGETVKVKAVSGDTESNELVFTVEPTQEEINDSKFYLVLSNETVTVDARGSEAVTLSAKLYNYNREEVTNDDISFNITDGKDYLELIDQGSYCTFKANGHGVATVEVYVDGIEVDAETATINVIVPPDALNLPEVFALRPNYDYNFSMNKYTYKNNVIDNTEKDALPFVATVKTTQSNPNPCTDVIYSFRHSDGSYGSDVAEWVDDKIIFNKTGKVTVTATSASGSRVEASVSYTFNINEGFNVYSFEEASNLLQQDYYNGQVVNFVALEVLTDGNGNEYKYQFVPKTALKSQETQTINDVISSYGNRIIAVNKSVHINGNNHKVNASNLRIATETEIAQIKNSGSVWENHGGLISAEPWTENPKDNQVVGNFFANFYDLEVIANTSIDYENKETPGAFKGSYLAAINIGNGEHIDANYTVDVKNVTASGARDGIRLCNVVSGTLDTAYTYNCYQNGLFVRSSRVKLSNLKFGACGAVGIELAPEDSNKAGVNNDLNQLITFEGTIDTTGNIQPPNTNYLKYYMGGAVPTLINASVIFNGLNDNQTAHILKREKILDENGQHVIDPNTKMPAYDMQELCLVTFILENAVTLPPQPNYSQAEYATYQAGGIIDATSLPTSGIDTTHQFIRLTVYQGENQPLGHALMYNLNYAG